MKWNVSVVILLVGLLLALVLVACGATSEPCPECWGTGRDDSDDDDGEDEGDSEDDEGDTSRI